MNNHNPTEGMAVTEWLDFMRINRSAFARKLGVAPQAVYQWEQRGYIPERHRAAIESKWINRTPDTLFESENE